MKVKNIKLKKVYKKILVLGDLHSPWMDWNALKAAKKWHDKHKPDLVIQLGDITDQKIWSRWTKDVDDYSPSEEFERAYADLKKLHEWFPNMIILRGNHDERVKLRAIEQGIPGQMFKDVNEVFNFKGWKWIDAGEKLVINTSRGKVLFQHGDEMGGNVAQKSRVLGMSVVQGHTHKASITFTQTLQSHFYGAEMGCMMETKSKAARYAQKNPLGVSIGFGVIDDGVPYFIDLKINRRVK